MTNPSEEKVQITVASNGGSGQSDIRSGFGELLYVEVEHTDPGDPTYYLQVLNRRGSVIWESLLLTGNTTVWIDEQVPARGSALKIKTSSLAGAFELWPNYGT